jgi:ferredoxin
VKKHIITVVNSDIKVICSEDRNLMDSLAAIAPKSIPKGCHGGGCGICRVHILSGETRKIAMSSKHISTEDHQNGIGLACRLFPMSDIELEFIEKK